MAQIGMAKSEWLQDRRGPLAAGRRSSPRAKVSGQAMAVFSREAGPGSLTYVSLVDASARGLGVLSPIQVEPGAAFSIVPETGSYPRAVGVVARCVAVDGVFHLGLATAARRVA